MRLSTTAAALVLLVSASAHGYVDLAPTLSRVIGSAGEITIVEIAEFDRAKRTLVLRAVRALKGEAPADPVRHRVAAAGEPMPRHILQWSRPGARGVLFASRDTALVCIGEGWYQVQAAAGGWWKAGAARPDLSLAYHGSVPRLIEALDRMLAGKDAVITTLPHGADEGASFDLALNRTGLPGLVKVQRIRANLAMPAMVMAISTNPAYVVGQGPADEADVPALRDRLKSADPAVRAAAADDLRTLGRKAAPAAAALAGLLPDADQRARFAAAAALLRIDPSDKAASTALAGGLRSADAVARCEAARAAGLAGDAVGPMSADLAALLSDADEPVRVSALQAIATLGPAAAAAADRVAALLDSPESAVDAADALGRIGVAARPAMKKLAAMLESDQATVRWAAVRAMAQIGGPEAKPVVDFIIAHLPGASDMDGYNMMIYLMLLGTDARDAKSAARAYRIRNPVLPSAVAWALESDKRLPWEGPGAGGRGGPPGGPDIAKFIYEGLIHERRERLRPVARLLAQKIADGTAGDVPEWGYGFLSCGGPADAVEILSPLLADGDLARRERAAVALGYMGPSARAAAPAVTSAAAAASDPRERRLLQWCLREIGRE